MRGKIETNLAYKILRTILFIIAFIVLGSNIVSCIKKNIDRGGEENKVSEKKIEEVLKEHTDDLMAIPGVVGTGQGLCNGKPCIKVFVVKKTPELENKIPEKLEGYPVKMEETGMIRTRSAGHPSVSK